MTDIIEDHLELLILIDVTSKPEEYTFRITEIARRGVYFFKNLPTSIPQCSAITLACEKATKIAQLYSKQFSEATRKKACEILSQQKFISHCVLFPSLPSTEQLKKLAHVYVKSANFCIEMVQKEADLKKLDTRIDPKKDGCLKKTFGSIFAEIPFQEALSLLTISNEFREVQHELIFDSCDP